MQYGHPEHIPFRDESRDDRRDPTTAVASSGPLQELEQLASRGTTGSSQDPARTPVLSADQQQQWHARQQWFAQQKMLMLQRQGQAAIAAQQQQLQSVIQERERFFEQLKQMIAMPKEQAAADESILASNTKKQEQTNDIDPSSKKNPLKNETLMAELVSKDQRPFQIDIERRVDELSLAVGELRLKTTHLESEKLRLEKEIRDLKSQLHQQRLHSSDSNRDGITSKVSKSSSDDVPSLSRHEKATTSIANNLSNPWGILPKVAEEIAMDDKNNRKPLDERVDQLTASMEKMQQTLDRFVTLCEPEKLQTFVQREDEEKRKKDLVVTKDREDELQKEISDLKVQMNLDEVKLIQMKLEWEVEREELQTKLQHYKSISQKGSTENSSTQRTAGEQKETMQQKVEEDFATTLQDTLRNIKEATKCLQNMLRISEQNDSLSASPSVAPEPESQTTIPPTPPIVEDHTRESLRQQFMSLLAKHDCSDLDCSIATFENAIKHDANKCTKDWKCNWKICPLVRARTEHLKVCNDKTQCDRCQDYMHVDERRIRDIISFLEFGCAVRCFPMNAFYRQNIIFLAVHAAVRYGLVVEETVDTETSQMGEMIDAQLSDSSSDVEERSGWEIVKSEDRPKV